MRYVCLVHCDGGAFASMSETEIEALDAESLAYDRELADKGHLVLAEALQPVDVTTTLRVRHGRLSATDGPFVETKEHLVGFLVIEARDLSEAIRLASGIPLARIGSIEVRPAMDLQQKGQERVGDLGDPDVEADRDQP